MEQDNSILGFGFQTYSMALVSMDLINLNSVACGMIRGCFPAC